MCALSIFKSALWPGKFRSKALWGCNPVQIKFCSAAYCSWAEYVWTALSSFLTHMHLYLLHTHEASPQFEKVFMDYPGLKSENAEFYCLIWNLLVVGWCTLHHSTL